jgi:hypothetical protein
MVVVWRLYGGCVAVAWWLCGGCMVVLKVSSPVNNSAIAWRIALSSAPKTRSADASAGRPCSCEAEIDQ